MNFLSLPFRMLGRAMREANTIYEEVMTKILTLTLLYFVTLWIGATWDIRWLTVGAMWIMAIITTVTYLTPGVSGVLGISEWLNKTDDPNKLSTIRAGLIIFISVVSNGFVALILGRLGVGKLFPLAVLVFLFVVICAIPVGKANLEIWLPRFSRAAVGVLFLSILFSINHVYYERLGIPTFGLLASESEMEVHNITLKNYEAVDKKEKERIQDEYQEKADAGSLTNEDLAEMHRRLKAVDDTAKLRGETLDPIARTDREIRAKRDMERVEAIRLLQTCAVSQKTVQSFKGEAAMLYKAHCEDSGSKGLRISEIRRGWPGLFQNETDAEDASGSHSVGSTKQSYFSLDFWKQKTFQWSKEWGWPIGLTAVLVGIIVLSHILIPVWVLIVGKKKFFNKEVVVAGSTTTTTVKKTGSLGTFVPWWWILIPLVILFLYFQLGSITGSPTWKNFQWEWGGWTTLKTPFDVVQKQDGTFCALPKPGKTLDSDYFRHSWIDGRGISHNEVLTPCNK